MRFSIPLLTLTTLSTLIFAHNLPFTFQHVFSVQITIAPALPSINVPGGTLVIEPITGGTVNGTINGTILSGFAYPTSLTNTTIDNPSITLYGLTDDNQTFYVSEMGTGSRACQVTRIEMKINGTRYQEFNNGFLVASVVPRNETFVDVEVYLVGNVASDCGA
ncbi:uncharacterized protein LY89DRAFT_740269 [Mollisia scopiformis]|uniref:Uncharacterized protein n=1 Tax=Mollisia scopiformis TaxID=149040 RepID=A0A132BDR3_MOLSC|nr:uncharacterized protein LY89DRAFT_740269 [Mollisia scopiformis]KUJ10560.1 hypothetical protein LY89DRAFT_740269 [Mollisia scopiformis]